MEAALDDAISWLKSGNGDVAIFDATNTTRERRHTVFTRIAVQNRCHQSQPGSSHVTLTDQ